MQHKPWDARQSSIVGVVASNLNSILRIFAAVAPNRSGMSAGLSEMWLGLGFLSLVLYHLFPSLGAFRCGTLPFQRPTATDRKFGVGITRRPLRD